MLSAMTTVAAVKNENIMATVEIAAIAAATIGHAIAAKAGAAAISPSPAKPLRRAGPTPRPCSAAMTVDADVATFSKRVRHAVAMFSHADAAIGMDVGPTAAARRSSITMIAARAAKVAVIGTAVETVAPTGAPDAVIGMMAVKIAADAVVT